MAEQEIIRSGGMTVLGRVRIRVEEPKAGKRCFQVAFEREDRKTRPGEHVLLAVHYYTHVLSRYPREDPKLDAFGMRLRQMVADIIEQGIWPGSNLLDYAGASERIRLVSPEDRFGGKEVRAVLFRTVLGEDLDLALEICPGWDEDALVDSVVALLQFLTDTVSEPEIELLDKTLRYLRTYIGEGAYYASPAAAQHLANRAFREAGGEVV